MSINRFIEQRKESWQRLEELVEDLHRKGPRKVQAERVDEMIYLYRQVASDLAHLRTGGADPAWVKKINRLAVRAHATIYRRRAAQRASIWHFLTVGYPRLFRSTYRFTLASFLLCAVVYTMAYSQVQEDPLLVADIMGGAMDEEFIGDKSAEDIQDRFVEGKGALGGSMMSSLITTNNIRVALLAFALGITLGIGTVYILSANAAMVGGIAGAFARSGIESTLWMTLLPHGALELSAIVIAGGSGLMIGWAIWCPGNRTRRRALREESVRAVQLVLGLIPAFIVAGMIEGFITGDTGIPQWVKVALGVSAAVIFFLYLLLGGRREIGEPPTSA